MELLCSNAIIQEFLFLDNHLCGATIFLLGEGTLFNHSKYGGKGFGLTLGPSIKMATVLPVFALNKDGDNTSCLGLSPLTKMVLMVQVT